MSPVIFIARNDPLATRVALRGALFNKPSSPISWFCLQRRGNHRAAFGFGNDVDRALHDDVGEIGAVTAVEHDVAVFESDDLAGKGKQFQAAMYPSWRTSVSCAANRFPG